MAERLGELIHGFCADIGERGEIGGGAGLGPHAAHREGVGGLASVTVQWLDAQGRTAAAAAGLELTPVTLQQLIIRKTGISERTSEKEFEAAS